MKIIAIFYFEKMLRGEYIKMRSNYLKPKLNKVEI